MKKKYKREITVIDLINIYWIVIEIFVFIGFLLKCSNEIVVMFAFLSLGVFFPIIYALYLMERKWYKLYLIIIMIGIVVCFCGMIITHLGIDNEKYQVSQYEVFEVKDNKIKVNGTNGDYKYLEIKNPLFKGIKTGNKINIRYKNDDLDSYFLVINKDIGIGLYIVGIVLINGWIFICIFSLVYVLVRLLNEKIQK